MKLRKMTIAAFAKSFAFFAVKYLNNTARFAKDGAKNSVQTSKP